MSARLAGLVFFLGVLYTGPEAMAQDACPGSLSHLRAHAGSYDDSKVLGDPAVSAAMSTALGPQLEHLQQNISVRGSIDLVSCELVISGNADHKGGEEAGIVSINLSTGRVSAAILSANGIDVFASGADYFAVPISIRDWLAVVASGFAYRFELPPNARQHVAPGA